MPPKNTQKSDKPAGKDTKAKDTKPAAVAKPAAKDTKAAAAPKGKVPAKGKVEKATPAQKAGKGAAAAAKGAKGAAAKGAKGAAAKAGKGAKGAKAVVKKPAEQRLSMWDNKKPNYGIGGDIQPKRDVTHFVKWPRYILLQRKRRVLNLRLKVPPSINQFTNTVDTNTAANIFKLLNKYRPEEKTDKKKRLLVAAQARKDNPGAPVKTPKPLIVKSGVNHVTKLIEEKRASFVVIAHDVDPIELVIFLPALCRKQDIPYVIVKSKARLGQVVHKKTASCLALTDVRDEDRQQFGQLVTVARAQYNSKYEEMRRKWGGGVLGPKSQAVANRKEKQKQVEAQEKAKYQ